MAAAVAEISPIPGLHVTPRHSDLNQSSLMYNNLKDDTDQPDVSEMHLKNLARIFFQYNVQKKFGLHLIHGHFKIGHDTVMLGRNVQEPSGCWTKPSSIDEVNLEDIHGHIFALTEEANFVAYEYREGPPVNMTEVDPQFFRDVIQYLRSNNLQSLLGLQVLSDDPQQRFAEFVLGPGAGTIMLKESEAKYSRIYRVTGWSFEEKDGIISCKGNDVHAATVKGTHQVFQDSKPLTGFRELKEALYGAEIL